jgi:hypothetical protein
MLFIMFKFSNGIHWWYTVGTSVADPDDPDPSDPYVFGPPESVTQRYGSEIPDLSIIKQL